MSTLPKGWAKAQLDDVAGVIRGRLNPREHESLPFVGMDNVQAHTMRIIGTVPSATMKSAAVHFIPGDVLYGRLRPYLNKVVQPTFEGLASAEFIPLTARQGVAPEFVRLRLNSVDFVEFASHLDEGDRPRVDWDGIRQFDLLLPPTSEQARIVEKVEALLSRLDAAAASLDSSQSKLKAYRTSVIRAAVEGRLVPTEAELAHKEGRSYEPADVLLERILKERRRRWEDAELEKLKSVGKATKDDRWKAKYEEPKSLDTKNLPELPEGWCWATADAVGEILLGRRRAPEYMGTARPYLRVANVRDDHLDLSNVKEMPFDDRHGQKYLVHPGDILVSEGQSPELVGQSAIYRGGVDGLCFQATLHRFRAVPGGPTPEFSQIVFRAHLRTGVFRRVASITTNIAHLTLEKFQESRFPLPPTAEQERIVLEIERRLSVADAIEKQMSTELSRIARLRQAILKWGFEGKLVDQDPNDELAETLLARVRAERAGVPAKQPNNRRRGAA